MMIKTLLSAFLLLVSASAIAQQSATELETQVAEHERAFAQSMADRDLEAFAEFVSLEAIFLSGENALNGREAVVQAWSAYFEAESAPFSWEPETVVVLDSGKLALSTGPVFNAEGVRTATFTSTWRLEEPGVWRVIFDRGTRYCAD